jgi:hypothetical protein
MGQVWCIEELSLIAHVMPSCRVGKRRKNSHIIVCYELLARDDLTVAKLSRRMTGMGNSALADAVMGSLWLPVSIRSKETGL